MHRQRLLNAGRACADADPVLGKLTHLQARLTRRALQPLPAVQNQKPVVAPRSRCGRRGPRSPSPCPRSVVAMKALSPRLLVHRRSSRRRRHPVPLADSWNWPGSTRSMSPRLLVLAAHVVDAAGDQAAPTGHAVTTSQHRMGQANRSSGRRNDTRPMPPLETRSPSRCPGTCASTLTTMAMNRLMVRMVGMSDSTRVAHDRHDHVRWIEAAARGLAQGADRALIVMTTVTSTISVAPKPACQLLADGGIGITWRDRKDAILERRTQGRRTWPRVRPGRMRCPGAAGLHGFTDAGTARSASWSQARQGWRPRPPRPASRWRSTARHRGRPVAWCWRASATGSGAQVRQAVAARAGPGSRQPCLKKLALALRAGAAARRRCAQPWPTWPTPATSTPPPSPSPKPAPSQRVVLVRAQRGRTARRVRPRRATVTGVELAKEWANRPANHATPTDLAAGRHAHLAKAAEHQLRGAGPKRGGQASGMGCLHGRGPGFGPAAALHRAAVQRRAPTAQAPTVLVGKGITFDTRRHFHQARTPRWTR